MVTSEGGSFWDSAMNYSNDILGLAEKGKNIFDSSSQKSINATAQESAQTKTAYQHTSTSQPINWKPWAIGAAAVTAFAAVIGFIKNSLD